jgi:hypothetical protein
MADNRNAEGPAGRRPIRGRYAILLLGMALLPAGAGLAGTSPYHRYVNERFGFSVEVPAELIAEEAPANGDGRAFYAPAGGMRLIASAIRNVLNENLTEFLAEDVASCLHQPPDYIARHNGWVVLSCTTRDGILYQKTMQSGRGVDSLYTSLRITYPADQRARWDGVVAHAAASLRPAPAQ